MKCQGIQLSINLQYQYSLCFAGVFSVHFFGSIDVRRIYMSICVICYRPMLWYLTAFFFCCSPILVWLLTEWHCNRIKAWTSNIRSRSIISNIIVSNYACIDLVCLQLVTRYVATLSSRKIHGYCFVCLVCDRMCFVWVGQLVSSECKDAMSKSKPF